MWFILWQFGESFCLNPNFVRFYLLRCVVQSKSFYFGFFFHSEIHLSRQKRFPANFISAYGRPVAWLYVSSLQKRCLWLLVLVHTLSEIERSCKETEITMLIFIAFAILWTLLRFFRHSHLHSAEQSARSWHALYIFTIRNNHLTDWKVHNFCAHDFNHDHFKHLRFSQVSHSLTIANDRHESCSSNS